MPLGLELRSESCMLERFSTISIVFFRDEVHREQ